MDNGQFHLHYCALYTSDRGRVYEALQYFRHQCEKTFLQLSTTMKRSLLRRFFDLIDSSHSVDIRTESVSIFTDWFRQERKNGGTICSLNYLLSKVLEMVKSTEYSIEARAQAIWCLENACDDRNSRSYLVKNGVLEACARIISDCWKPVLPENLMQSVANLCFGYAENAAYCRPLFYPFCRIIQSDLIDDASLLQTCTALRNVTERSAEVVQAILDCGLHRYLVELIGKTKTTSGRDQAILTTAIHVIGNLVCYSDLQAQAVLDAGVLPALRNSLCHSNASVATRTCWTLSNIAAGTAKQRRMILERGDLMSILILEGYHDSPNVRTEATTTVCSMIIYGDRPCRDDIVERGALDLICERVIDHNSDFTLVKLILSTYKALFPLFLDGRVIVIKPSAVEARLWDLLEKLPWRVSGEEEREFGILCNEILLLYF